MMRAGRGAILAWCALLAGCVSPDGRVAQKAVENYLGDFRHQRLSGPFGKADRRKLAVLPKTSAERANALLEQGGAFFVIFLPHDSSPGATSPMGEGGKVLRLVFVVGDKVVADYPAIN